MDELAYYYLIQTDTLFNGTIAGVCFVSIIMALLLWSERILNSCEHLIGWYLNLDKIEQRTGDYFGAQAKQEAEIKAYNAHTQNNQKSLWREGKRVLTGSGLIAGERESPPKATFFGRLDGNIVHEEGPYELKYLNYYEKLHWEDKMAQNPDLRAKTTTK